MKKLNRTAPLIAAMVSLALLAACGKQEAEDAAKKADQAAAEAKAKAESAAKEAEAAAKDAAKEAEAFALAAEAYVYGYPLVTMEMTRRIMTNVEKPEGTRAPMGQFVRCASYPNAQYRDVTAPNADTLYTTAWFDVQQGAVDRQRARHEGPLLPAADARRLDRRVPGAGQAHHRHGGADLRHHRPGLDGRTAQGRDRIQVAHRPGLAAGPHLQHRHARGLQGGSRAAGQDHGRAAVRLGKPYTPEPGKVDPAIDMKTAVREQVDALDANAYFKLLAELMKTNPPSADDAPMVAKLAKIGIVPGQDFDPSKLDPAVAKGMAKAPKPAQEQIMAWLKEGIAAGDFKLENGWAFSTKVGLYGTTTCSAR